VLEGAPAIVSAVDRYVHCDSAREADIVTPEVRAALPAGPVPHFDADELRADGRKLGLGSSAAILVASLAAARAEPGADEAALRRAIQAPALSAHRQAQGGGSGVDVAASIWGGTLIVLRRGAQELQMTMVELPGELVVEAWASDVSASTPALLAKVATFREERPGDYAPIMKSLIAAARDAVRALGREHLGELVAALNAQRRGLARLGDFAGAPIVTPAVAELATWADTRGAAVLPSGAGGGDIVLWVSDRPAPSEFRALGARLGHRHVPLALHARGVFCTPAESTTHLGS
jgi:phosphomevalonate kinase